MKTKKNNNECTHRSRNKSAVNIIQHRISDLPNDVLLNILERVDTPDAVRTCILSKKMAMLPNRLSQFVVDVDSFIPKGNRSGVSSSLLIRDLVRMNGVVADVTNNILNFRNPQDPLHQLRLRFYLRYYDFISIGRAVAHAMATHEMDTIEFILLTEKGRTMCTPDDLLFFAKQFNTFFSAYPCVFAGLTRLQIENLRFGQSDIPNILLTCKRLEFLRMYNCKLESPTVLRVKHQHLVELQIAFGNFETVQLVNLPKLERMTCEIWISYQEPLFFGHTPRLSSLSLGDIGVNWQGDLQLSHFLAKVPSIHELNLNFESEKIWVVPESPNGLAPVLCELRHVTLLHLPEGCNIAWTMFIVEAAPNLKELSITVWDHWCKMLKDKKRRQKNGYCEKSNVEWEPSVSNLEHQNLAKLTIYGFQPDDNFVGYVRRVMEAAINLKEISLYDRKVLECCQDLDPKIKVVPSRYPRTMEEQESLKKEMTEGLLLGMASSSDVIHFRS